MNSCKFIISGPPNLLRFIKKTAVYLSNRLFDNLKEFFDMSEPISIIEDKLYHALRCLFAEYILLNDPSSPILEIKSWIARNKMLVYSLLIKISFGKKEMKLKLKKILKPKRDFSWTILEILRGLNKDETIIHQHKEELFSLLTAFGKIFFCRKCKYYRKVSRILPDIKVHSASVSALHSLLNIVLRLRKPIYLGKIALPLDYLITIATAENYAFA